MKKFEDCIEGEDYYKENGRVVFLPKYLLTRPCCEGACRHCPYGFKPVMREFEIIDMGDE